MSTSPRKDSHLYKVGDYVWFELQRWCEPKNHTLGRIKEIHYNDAGVRWFTIATLDNRQVVFRTKDQFTPATDSEVAWYLVTNEN